jgi:hypothetical protein
MLIPPSGRGWPSTCRPQHISTGYGTMLLRNRALTGKSLSGNGRAAADPGLVR